jgi:hypothetical protein
MSSDNEVQHISLHTAEDFLNAISPRSRYLEGGLQRYSHYFIYRGHAGDSWKLIPKALRLRELIEMPLHGVYPGYGGAARAVRETRYF